jgi:DNA-binding CsgD family transcriptional regulator/PAS domain-containing protein
VEKPAGLVDSIYVCAMLPELWPGVLDRLAAIAGARGGLLFAVNRRILNWTASDISRENMARFVGGDLIVRSRRLDRIVGLNHAGFVRDNDHYTAEEMAQDPIYRDFLWPNGMGWAAATAIKIPTGDVVVLSLERERARGPVDLGAIPHLDALRPHIARSALLSARLQLERARVASETLALLGLPALVLDVGGRVVTANKAAEALDGYLRWGAQDRVAMGDAAVNSLFRQAVTSLGSNTDAPVRSFAIRGTEALPAMIAHLIPICGTARDLFVRCAAILVLMPVTMPQAPPIELVQSLFDLTPAEARVARSLVSGDTVDEIAAQGGVSPHTVRTQVRGILGKTGCRRQTEMVALLAGVSIPGS